MFSGIGPARRKGERQIRRLVYHRRRLGGGYNKAAIPLESEQGPFVIPRYANGKFKTYCGKTYGGQIWFNVLNVMGGCPQGFVDAVHACTDQRLKVVSRNNTTCKLSCTSAFDASTPGANTIHVGEVVT